MSSVDWEAFSAQLADIDVGMVEREAALGGICAAILRSAGDDSAMACLLTALVLAAHYESGAASNFDTFISEDAFRRIYEDLERIHAVE